MAGQSDTLNIGSIRLRKEYPVETIQLQRAQEPVNDPQAAAAARARIAAIHASTALVRPETVPAAPTADLITDRNLLADQIAKTPIVTRPQIPSALSPVLTAIGIFLLVLLLFKAPIIISQISYTFGPKPSSAPAVTTASAVVPAANTISIPKINVDAPVNYLASIQESDIETSLQTGVVHYGDTALPGQAGNVAIFGHSSNDWWEPGNYKFVFVLLDKLAPGDNITIDYQSKRYVYQVTNSQVVNPTDISVLDPTSTPTLSLITCTPPGTSLRRLVVTAKQIYPNPATAPTAPATTSASSSNGTLPSSAPGFLNEVNQAWTGVENGFKSLFGASSTSQKPSAPATANGELPAAN
ncbi:MAG TPA: class D sortase [Candidatus Saccharimonadia bacterium]|nr:class D sortase [Candidatus Saccharimonadia bacterium]